MAVDAIDVFVAEKLFGKRSPFGAAPMRGICIEDGVVDVVYHGMKIEEAVKKAEEKVRQAHDVWQAPKLKKSAT